MSPSKKAKAPDEMTALLAEPQRVGKYEVRAWTVKRFALVYPPLRRIIGQLAAQGLTWANLEGFIGGQLLDCLPAILPEIPPFLAASLDIPLEEAEDLDVATAMALVLINFSQNLEPLKNFSALIPKISQGIGASTPSA
jgi:hypothetical protein